MAKPVSWTPELVSRFWDLLAEVSLLSRFSFAKAAGPSMIRLVGPYLDRNSDYIDYGGGDGYLCQYLVEQGFRCAVYEPSKVGVKNLTSRLGDNPNFLGAFQTIEGGQFDGVFCLEVIEHVLEEGIKQFVTELHRILKPAGHVFITCPNNENLEDNSVVCPVCESHFHRWQHVRTLSVADVTALLERRDLETVWAGLVGFEAAESIRHWCECRDQGKRYIDRNLPPLHKLARFIIGEKKKSDDGVDLKIGSENNIVLVARKSRK